MLKKNLDSLTATGLPVYASEFDINQQNDATQNARYQEFFPIFWEDPGVYGITLWGYTQNETWKPYTYLVTTSEGERPALQWLRNYMLKGPTPPSPILISPGIITNASRRPTYQWHSALHATSYELQVALDFEFQLVVVDTTTADTTATPSTVLDDTLGFYWRVCGMIPQERVSIRVFHFSRQERSSMSEGQARAERICLVPKLSEPVQPDDSDQLSISSKQFCELEGVRYSWEDRSNAR